ncbi:hypothetical protein FAIPA1_50062 [Frankia sp. AiPs1]|uniref:hypothetical protein n=1 Tax=Frankia sp. AiPa1 TaxID=573492 RepID=UPI00202B233E|nr:hypothetical protein [Frankia sp. AiPa1]MCL9762044.1 hypothetical protein [Frankia sp. AiPa1]
MEQRLLWGDARGFGTAASFTWDVYAVVAEELAEQAAVAIENFIPRRQRSATTARASVVPATITT